MSIRTEVLGALLKAPSGLTIADIVDNLVGYNFGQIYDAIKHAEKECYVQKGEYIDEGLLWEITPHGQAFIKKELPRRGNPKKPRPSSKVIAPPLTKVEQELADHFDRVFDSIEPEPAPHIPIAYKTAEEINTFQNGTVVDVGQHYRYEYKGIKIDPFRIAQIYNIQDFALQTALKKILCAGNRGFKDLRQDLLDVRCAIDRKLEMMMEDAV